MTEKKKKEPIKKDLVTPENWKIMNNVSDLEFAGFKATLKSEEYTENDLNKLFEEYQNKPFFIEDKGGE